MHVNKLSSEQIKWNNTNNGYGIVLLVCKLTIHQVYITSLFFYYNFFFSIFKRLVEKAIS
ncbi:hypothetical protein MtrunA17_Chr7g0267821 [Medicago truncatula]|uniref:Transmembrane protein n=1 Tax=Medicago truncatula TaxID=3880 RepID=A0A396H7Q1_MEDTR|nr:hypothetical protein MtrunA17_Chr7g0267821 [Medicago truncatula]